MTDSCCVLWHALWSQRVCSCVQCCNSSCLLFLQSDSGRRFKTGLQAPRRTGSREEGLRGHAPPQMARSSTSARKSRGRRKGSHPLSFQAIKTPCGRGHFCFPSQVVSIYKIFSFTCSKQSWYAVQCFWERPLSSAKHAESKAA